MASPGLQSLAALRLQAQQRADMVGSNFVTLTEWNGYISQSYKELYDLLIAAFGNDYFVATPYAITTDGMSALYALPGDFYKILGVDLVLSQAPQGLVSLKRFNFNERNKYSYPAVQTYYGSNMRYRLSSNSLWLEPLPTAGQVLQVWYVPEPTNLQVNVVANLTTGSPTVALSDTSQLSVGMSVTAPQGIATNTTISALSANTSITLSTNATLTAQTLLQAYSDATTINGISGWEEYVIVDSAIKALVKEESPDAQALMAQKQALKQRLDDMAANRDQNQPMTVSDTQGEDFLDGFGWG